jgi:hypothetical protein
LGLNENIVCHFLAAEWRKDMGFFQIRSSDFDKSHQYRIVPKSFKETQPFHRDQKVIAEFEWNPEATGGTFRNKSSDPINFLVKYPKRYDFLHQQNLPKDDGVAITFPHPLPTEGCLMYLK